MNVDLAGLFVDGRAGRMDPVMEGLLDLVVQTG
jgi:hypothetical protein